MGRGMEEKYKEINMERENTNSPFEKSYGKLLL